MPTGEQQQEAEHDAWLFPQRRRKPRGRGNPSDGFGPVRRAQENTGELPFNPYLMNNLGQKRHPVQTGQGAFGVGPEGTGQIEVPMRSSRPAVRRFGNRGDEVPPARINHTPDANTRQGAKNVFKLIQAVHHKNVIKEALETGIYPRGMVKQATRLSDFIKPAAPNEKVRIQTRHNTDSWIKGNLNILHEHYETVIQGLKHVEISKVSLDIAKGWAGKRYGARMKASTLPMVESLLENEKQLGDECLQTAGGNGEDKVTEEMPKIDLNDEEQFPALPTQAPVKVNFTRKNTLSLGQRKTLTEEIQELGGSGEGETDTLPDEGGDSNPKNKLKVKEGGRNLMDGKNLTHVNKMAYSNVAVNLETEIEQLPASPSTPCLTHLERRAVFTQLQTHSIVPAPNTAPPRSRRPPSLAGLHSPQDIQRPAANQHNRLRIKTKTNTGEKQVAEMMIETPEQRGKAATRSGVSLVHSDPPHPKFTCEFDMNKHTSGDDSTTESSEGTRTVGQEMNVRVDHKGIAKEEYNVPKYHRAGKGKKLQEWRIQATRPILILGDSNLNRIPPFRNKNIQVDSYPGANFYHFVKIFGRTPACEEVKLVLLSLGINNKDLDPYNISIKHLRGMLREAQSVFPNAEIYVAKIQFADALTALQKENLTVINNFIESHLNYLPCIPPEQFRTVSDNIHWSEETAREIFKSWCENLRLEAGLE